MNTNKFELYPTTKVMQWERNQTCKESILHDSTYIQFKNQLKLIHADKSQDKGYPWGRGRGEGAPLGLVMFCLWGAVEYLGMFIENSLSCILRICTFFCMYVILFYKSNPRFLWGKKHKESA